MNHENWFCQPWIGRLFSSKTHSSFLFCSQDLYQYLANSHPLFSICLHHELNPVGWQLRSLMFFGSTAFGLAISNAIYLLFVMDPAKRDIDIDRSYLTLQTGEGTGIDYIDQNLFLTQIEVTNGMIALWIFGGICNAFYHLTIRTVASCSCVGGGATASGKEKGAGGAGRLRTYLVMFLVLIIVTGSTLGVLVRAAHESNQQNEEIANKLRISYTPNAESYRFVLAYFVELAFSLLLWNPIVGVLLFSGWLGCTRLPVLGGRPAELKALAMAAQQQKEAVNSSGTDTSNSTSTREKSLNNV